MKNIILFGFIVLTWSCTGKSKNLYQAEQEQVEKNAKPINQAVLSDTNHLSLYLTFEVIDGQINPNPKTAEMVPMPVGKPAEVGTFRVTVLDTNKRQLYTRLMESPLTVRSCDVGSKPSISTLTKGDISIAIPYSATMSLLHLEDEGNRDMKPVETNLAAVLNRLRERQPNNDKK